MKYKVVILIDGKGNALIGKETQYSLADDLEQALDLIVKAETKNQHVLEASIESISL